MGASMEQLSPTMADDDRQQGEVFSSERIFHLALLLDEDVPLIAAILERRRRARND